MYLQQENPNEQNKYDATFASNFPLISLSLHLNERNSVCCLAISFWCSDHFDKISICAVPVKIVKGMTTAKCNRGPLVIPLYCTSTGEISVRHSYSSVLSNLTVVGGCLCRRYRRNIFLRGSDNSLCQEKENQLHTLEMNVPIVWRDK